VLVNLYKSKTPLSVFTLPLVIGLVALSLLTNPTGANVYFFKWQTAFFGQIQAISWLNFLLAGGMISLNAHRLNNVFNRNSFYSKDTFLPGFIYVSGLVLFKSLDFSPLMVAHFFIIGALSQLLQLKRQEPSKDLVFKASFLVGLAIVFSPLTISLCILPWIALGLVKPFVWREWVVVILGLAIPVFFHYAIHFLATGQVKVEQMEVIINDPEITWTILESVVYILSAAVLIVGVFKFLVIIRGQVVNYKKMSQVILFSAILAGFSLIVGWYFFDQLYLVVLLPLSFIVSVQLLNAGRVQLANGLVMLWFITSAVNLFF
jgi:hypothetical protein